MFGHDFLHDRATDLEFLNLKVQSVCSNHSQGSCLAFTA